MLLEGINDAKERIHEAADRIALESARKDVINPAQTYIETYKLIISFLLGKQLDLGLELAWGIIANVSGGNWDIQTDEWQNAAARWRDKYFKGFDEEKVD